MDAVRLMGEMVVKAATLTKDQDSIGCAKLVVFCNAPDDNPFMAGAFHGVTEEDAIINVGVSGPGVVKTALEQVRGESFEVLCETIKKTAFKVTRVGQLVAQEASKRLNIPFGIIDLSLAPTPAIGDSVADILCEIGLEFAGAPGKMCIRDRAYMMPMLYYVMNMGNGKKYLGKWYLNSMSAGSFTEKWYLFFTGILFVLLALLFRTYAGKMNIQIARKKKIPQKA